MCATPTVALVAWGGSGSGSSWVGWFQGRFDGRSKLERAGVIRGTVMRSRRTTGNAFHDHRIAEYVASAHRLEARAA